MMSIDGFGAVEGVISEEADIDCMYLAHLPCKAKLHLLVEGLQSPPPYIPRTETLPKK